jgi:SPP1 family predicted phage head-tail adaptor
MIGSLQHRIVIQAPSAGQDAIGQPVSGWATVATVWADVRFLAGLEAIKADSVASMLKVSVRIRAREVTNAMRVLHDGKVLQIVAVLPSADRRWVDLACEVVQ